MSRPTEPSILEQLGGLSGMIATVIPVLVLVPVNARWGLGPALVSAVVVAVLIFLWRLARRETLMPAVSGILGVALCALIAWLTGDAKGYFAYGIWYSLVAGIAFTVSTLVRWPLVGVIWHGINGEPQRWRSSRTGIRVYSVATLAWAAVFFARFIVQQWLYTQDDAVGILGITRILMGLPLTAVVVLITVWAVRTAGRAERVGRHAALPTADSEAEQ
ncbi:DUF3159 domain-containing protein [Corynebacterium terpenotabidum]|uniref:DUF3159 domain-containing protein n=1 Tax=Corynebacterium terpenotabidum Y-11 TaxID=1200352 RepID=S4XCN9_9CORY|nr:DUF3159 domain-containing protein [Corynebacterium terpenotabidum]AGP30897.1 hypothetical protein A606_06250 [Corynebacterium terpenotabidum Y-11]